MFLINCILHIVNINNIIHRKIFRLAYAQRRYAKCPVSKCTYHQHSAVYSYTDSNSNRENKISNSHGMVDPVSQTERTFFTVLQDANIQVMIKIEALLLPYIAKLKDLLMSSSFGQLAAMMHR